MLIFNDLKKENNLYNKDHPGEPILLDGFEPPEYVQWIMKEYKERKGTRREKKVIYIAF